MSETGNAAAPDTDLVGWFEEQKLPYNDVVSNSLDEWGVLCVEQLKFIPGDDFLGMYDADKLVVRETAKLALEKLKQEGPVDLTKCVVGQVASAPARSRNKKDSIAGKPSPKQIPRNTKYALGGQDPVLDGIVRLWSTTGHQNNLLRITVCNALRAGYTKAKIARAVRTRAFGPWEGVGKVDPIYKKIKSTLLRIHNDMRNGKFDDLDGAQNQEEYRKVLTSKSVKVGARGRKCGTKVETGAKDRKEGTKAKPDDLAAPGLPPLNDYGG